MKIKLPSLAAAAVLSVSVAAGSANAAGPGAGLNASPAINKSVLDSNLKQVSYYGYSYHYYHHCMRLRYLARMGSRWAASSTSACAATAMATGIASAGFCTGRISSTVTRMPAGSTGSATRVC